MRFARMDVNKVRCRLVAKAFRRVVLTGTSARPQACCKGCMLPEIHSTVPNMPKLLLHAFMCVTCPVRRPGRPL